MEYNSFYGGRRGASFVIVKRYKRLNAPKKTDEVWNKIIREDLHLAEDAAITDAQRQAWVIDNCMIPAFQQGGAYKTVNYDEYVLIDTYNKNDADNGKIYRRGYDYTNEMGGAEFIGQIVGPAGMAPHVEMKTTEEVEELVEQDGLVELDDTGNYIDEEGNTYRRTADSYIPYADLLPGKYWDNQGEAKYNDNIQYVACSVRDKRSHETTVHIGFKIPFMISEYTAETISPYYHRTDVVDVDEDGRTDPSQKDADGNWTEIYDTQDHSISLDDNGNLKDDDTYDIHHNELIRRTDEMFPPDDPEHPGMPKHPFFSRWNISIPKGIKGNAFKNFRVTTYADEMARIAEETATPGKPVKRLVGYNLEPTSKGSNAPHGSIKDPETRKILVYDYYNYDRNESGEPISLFLGDYNFITDFNIDMDGTVTIEYTNDDTDTYPNLFKFVDKTQINPETGFYEIFYNYPYEPDYKNKFIESTDEEYLADKRYYSFNEETEEYTLLEEETDYNTGDIISNTVYNEAPTYYSTHLQYLKDITLDETGKMTFYYSYKDGVEQKTESFPNKIKWIDNVEFIPNVDYPGPQSSSHLRVTFNVLEDPNDPMSDKVHKDWDLRWLNGLTIDQDGTVTLKYTVGDDVVLDEKLLWPEHLSINTHGEANIEGEGSQKVVVRYNHQIGEDEEGNPIYTEEIGEPLNYIMKTAITADYHLIVLYADPAKRQQIINDGKNYQKHFNEIATEEELLAMTPMGGTIYKALDTGKVYVWQNNEFVEIENSLGYEGRNDWADLGYIGYGTLGSLTAYEQDEAAQDIASHLPPYSFWMIIEDIDDGEPEEQEEP